jgi:hypothetical protein
MSRHEEERQLRPELSLESMPGLQSLWSLSIISSAACTPTFLADYVFSKGTPFMAPLAPPLIAFAHSVVTIREALAAVSGRGFLQ